MNDQKWVYVEDKDGCLIAKEFISRTVAFGALKKMFTGVIGTSQESDHCITFKVYN